MKYYYTDIRKASLMLSEYDILMYMGDYEYIYRCNYAKKFKNWDKKIYIHPDWHEMLKPQIGDLIELLPPFDICDQKEKLSVFIKDEEHRRYLENKNWVIIQRNNKAFFMPECEE